MVFRYKKELNKLTEVVSNIADGDLTAKVVSHKGTSIKELGEGINALLFNLKSLIGKVSTSNEKTLNFAQEAVEEYYTCH